jgi:hypothetical protein
MNTQDQIWVIKNKIRDIRSSIACESNIDYKSQYAEIYKLEQQLNTLENMVKITSENNE